MTPRQHKEFVLEQRKDAEEKSKAWHVPLFSNGKKLKTALREINSWRLNSGDVPWIIRFVENPKSILCDFDVFPGCVDLHSHDCIHIILGRGVLPKDEAFVIGFTMGSTKRLGWFREKLFLFITRWLYPDGYRFYDEERQVFQLGLMAGRKCEKDLTKINFKSLENNSISSIRKALGVETKFVKICYLLEKKVFVDCRESQRLL